MLRLLYILLFACVALLGNYSPELERSAVCHAPQSEVVAEHHTEQFVCQRECNSDMIRTSSSGAIIVQSNTATSQQVRHRGEEQLKFYASAVPARRAGHVTRIFEFNCFRSALRVTYYLYALCRLRI